MKKLITLLCVLVLGIIFMLGGASAVAQETLNSVSMKSTYKVQTGIIGYPRVIAKIDTKQDLVSLKTEKTPTVGVFRVKAESNVLKLVDVNGAVISNDGADVTLVGCLNEYSENIIPAFYVSKGDTQTATLLTNFIKDNKFIDAFVASNDAEIIKSVIYYKNANGEDRRREVGGMLFVDESIDWDNWYDLSVICASAGARLAVLDIDDYSRQDLREQEKHYEAFGLNLYFQADTDEQIYKAILMGVDGIVTTEFDRAISILETDFTETTLIRPFVTQAHRGTDVVYQENSLEGIIVAAKAGATSVEVDPRLTKDKQIVLMHDDTLDRVSGGSGYVKDYTLEQIKAMTLRVNPSAPDAKICTLEEVFSTLRDMDVQTKIALDAKETNIEFYQILKDLVDKYDAYDLIASIGTADVSHREHAYDLFPELVRYNAVGRMHVGYEPNKYTTGLDQISNWLKYIVMEQGLELTMGGVGPYYTYVSKVSNANAKPELIDLCRDRALKTFPYQFDTLELIEEAVMNGVTVLSSGNIAYVQDMLDRLESKGNISANVGETVVIKAIAYATNEKASERTCEYIVIGGDANVLSTDNGTTIASKSGSVTVAPYITYSKGNLTYRLYSDPITVRVS